MRIIRAAVRRRLAHLRKYARNRDKQGGVTARPAFLPFAAVVRAALNRARIGRAIEAAFLAAVVGACGPIVPRGDVGEGGAVHGLLRACMRLGASADAGPGAPRTWFNSFCAPFFGWPTVGDDAGEVAHGG